MSRVDNGWLIRNGLRINLAEVTAIGVVPEDKQDVMFVYLRGVAQPMVVPATREGSAEMLADFDTWRAGR